jgi:hypothetical protein
LVKDVLLANNKIPFSHRNKSRTEVALALIHLDTCDPMKKKSLNRSMYFVTFIDDDFRLITIVFFKTKSDVFLMF